MYKIVIENKLNYVKNKIIRYYKLLFLEVSNKYYSQ